MQRGRNKVQERDVAEKVAVKTTLGRSEVFVQTSDGDELLDSGLGQ